VAVPSSSASERLPVSSYSLPSAPAPAPAGPAAAAGAPARPTGPLLPPAGPLLPGAPGSALQASAQGPATLPAAGAPAPGGSVPGSYARSQPRVYSGAQARLMPCLQAALGRQHTSSCSLVVQAAAQADATLQGLPWSRLCLFRVWRAVCDMPGAEQLAHAHCACC